MNCPKCKSSKLDVIDSRERQNENTKYRRRSCLVCGYRFSTIETIDERKYKKMKVVLDPGAIMPTRAHSTDAGLDLYAPHDFILPQSTASTEETLDGFLAKAGHYTVDTGVHVAIPAGYVGMIKSKSGLNVNHGVISEGVIDSGYTGSIRVKLYNLGKDRVFIAKGQKISQLVILPIITPNLELVGSLEETERGNGGFGSTGAF